MSPGYTPSIRIRLTQPLTLLKSKQYAGFSWFKPISATRLNKMKMSKIFTLPIISQKQNSQQDN
ncbi:hypothetical protein BpHYR1_053057 [Brachionus plicatilis]|uniref:Uncharacterized protein n=1 Tax=Brachionus plicatilis TaxID=10195 RepID=A0A3M7T034_BRAPC|nr:hypothetical protein BpHYR1_053057 [Brachionus plicatilis]